ncbi:MAG: N-acetyltransferase [Nitrospirales bacterium]|nr:N-acetyltransferase [Nitrospirales bacterium]
MAVLPVDDKRSRRAFHQLPWTIYHEDPAWVPPLLLERREHVSQRNPYFAHAEAKFWIAYRNEKPVGRISAQIDQLYLESYKDGTGFFGMLEAENDPQVFQALFSTVEVWLRQQGMQQIRGPFNLSVNEECGLLVEGFATAPMVMMGHARPYYASLVEAQGYQPVKDMFAYIMDSVFETPPFMEKVLARLGAGIRIRPLQRSRFDEEMETLRDIFNDAWSENWGFLPFTPAEFRHVASTLKLLVDDDFVQIAEVDGVPAAMIVVFPNVNEAIRDLNGRVWPFGWAKLLWRLKVAYPKTARIPLMGVRKRFQRTPLGIALAYAVIHAVRAPGAKRQVERVEMSWILEDNVGMRSILNSLGAHPYKRYCLYEKSLKGVSNHSNLCQ